MIQQPRIGAEALKSNPQPRKLSSASALASHFRRIILLGAMSLTACGGKTTSADHYGSADFGPRDQADAGTLVVDIDVRQPEGSDSLPDTQPVQDAGFTKVDPIYADAGTTQTECPTTGTNNPLTPQDCCQTLEDVIPLYGPDGQPAGWSVNPDRTNTQCEIWKGDFTYDDEGCLQVNDLSCNDHPEGSSGI